MATRCDDTKARTLERATELLRLHWCRALTMEAPILRVVGGLRAALEAVLEAPGTAYLRRKEGFSATCSLPGPTP